MVILGLSASIATKTELAVVFWLLFVASELLMKSFVLLCVVVGPGLGCAVPLGAILALVGPVVEAQALIFFFHFENVEFIN